MRNTIAAETFDLLGYAEIDVLPATRYQYVERRVSRTKTLDGGAVVNDGGFSDADRIIDISWQTRDETLHRSVERLVQLHPRVVVSTEAGVFLASPERYTPGAAESRLRMLVQSKLSA